jgi:hypothetical protein
VKLVDANTGRQAHEFVAAAVIASGGKLALLEHHHEAYMVNTE